MNYNYTEEARVQLAKEWRKIAAIKDITELDGDIRIAASKIITILKNEENSTKKTFYDYLERYLVKQYMINTEDFVEFVVRKQEERKDINGKQALLTKQRLTKCLENRSFIPQKRDFVFRLAFVLGMTDEECEELLTKGMNERGFNFKNPVELIYYFCLKFGYGYLTAQKFIEEFDNIDAETLPDDDRSTTMVHDDFTLRFQNSTMKQDELEKVLIECLGEIKSKYIIGFTDDDVCNKRLNEKFIEVLNKVRNEIGLYNADKSGNESSLKESVKSAGEKYDKTRQVTKDDMTSLYDVSKFLYRDYSEYESAGIEKYITDIKESMFELPLDIKSNRLTKERLHHLALEEVDGKDRYAQRQDLITLVFLYYELALEDEQDRIVRFEDFSEVMNKMLGMCGLLSLNPNNLYEYFIMLCMCTDDPLGTFQEVFVQTIKNEV